MLIIPTDSSGTLREYSERVALDGAVYELDFAWNTRTDHWYLSVYTDAGTPIAQGCMVINGVDLLRSCTAIGRPPGQIFAVPTDRRNEHAGVAGLGSRVQLYYREAADLAGGA